jgi:hypothetical protein
MWFVEMFDPRNLQNFQYLWSFYLYITPQNNNIPRIELPFSISLHMADSYIQM